MILEAARLDKPSPLVTEKHELRQRLAHNKKLQRAFDRLVAKLESGKIGPVDRMLLTCNFLTRLAEDLDSRLEKEFLTKELAERHYQGIMKAIQNLSDKVVWYQKEAHKQRVAFQLERSKIEKEHESIDD
jgi:hypothetical protein